MHISWLFILCTSFVQADFIPQIGKLHDYIAFIILHFITYFCIVLHFCIYSMSVYVNGNSNSTIIIVITSNSDTAGYDGDSSSEGDLDLT